MMQTILLSRHQNKEFIDDVIYETREQIPEIVEYLQNTINQMKSLNYILDDTFDPDEAFEMLHEDLPDGHIKGQKEYFIADIIRLCSIFYSLTTSKKMRIQIEIVKTDMCRLFHQDNYRQRLLCTYIGPGTEWLNHSNVNQEALGKGCNTKIVKDFQKINKAKAFEVILLKGAKYKERELGVIHRSPPIEKEKKVRVLLKIDE